MMTTVLNDALHDRPAVLSPRSRLYGALSDGFSFPDVRLFESLLDRTWQRDMDAALESLPYRFRPSGLHWTAPSSSDEMQTEYIRLFQIGGRGGPPCPLHEGHYTRDRSATLQSIIRFYNFFGFRVVECVMPDHLSVQLEFMAELASEGAEDEASRLRAQRDFLRAHLIWTHDLASRATGSRAEPFYRSLALLTSRLIAAEQLYIADALGGSDGRS
jgi:DMSO reductase family type II enzyme chaperone